MSDTCKQYAHNLQSMRGHTVLVMSGNEEILDGVMTEMGLNDAAVVARVAGVENSNTVYRWRTGRTNLNDRKLSRVLTSLGVEAMHRDCCRLVMTGEPWAALEASPEE